MLDAEQKMKLLISDRPWEHEPDNEEWIDEATGYKCTVWRHPTAGHLCGYVHLPEGHRCHGGSYDWLNDMVVDVHGGLTYCEEDKGTREWVVGFDCGHAEDFSPYITMTLMKYNEMNIESVEFKLRTETYRTFEWVKSEVVLLAGQLKLLGEVK